MLKLYNKEHKAIGVLTNSKDYKIEYVLSGEDLLEFSLSIYDENIHLVEEEGYVRNKNNEYVIKAVDPSDNFKRFTCNVNVEAIVGKAIANFETSNNKLDDTIRLAIAGTGWILVDSGITKRRTVRLTNTNALEVLREVRKVFSVDFRYDAINKKIYVYEKFGEDKGVYFSDELNLKSLSIPSDTYDYATRLYPYGKDGLTIGEINNGKEYIDNFQYSNKIIEVIWKDERYTDVNSLKEDAEAKLEELSKPKRSYQTSVTDLAKQSEEYSYLDFFLGDTVTLLSKSEKFRDKQRIVKYIEYPNNPSENTCELGNTILTFEELQKENEYKNQTVDNITTGNGTVNGESIDGISTEQIYDFEAEVAKITDLTVINAEITNLKAQNVTITGKLTAIEGEFGTLKANVGVIDKLTVTHTAQINALEANKASITQLEAVSAKIGTVEAEVGKIQTLINGNLSSENIQAGGITSDKLTIANGFITNAMIANLDVSKINAGDISTNKFRIVSDSGKMLIADNAIQIKDNNRVRVQIGKDASNDYSMYVWDASGKLMFDATGLKADGIKNKIIRDDMISDNANINGGKINISSLITEVNKDTNTNTIKSTKIMLNNQNQTLDVAFNQLKTQADDTKSLTESHSTTIGVMQGQITTAINNTQIVRDGQTILLKDDYNRTVQTVNSMNSTIGSHTTKINENTGKITGVETRVNTVERDLDGITARVSSTEKNVTTVTNIANAANSNATNALNKANSANTLADSKAKVFTSQPTVPYKVGDLWVQGTTGDVMKCKTARATGSYTASDWEKASKYTDDTKADAVDGKVTTLEGTVSATTSKVAEITTNLEGITSRVSTVENKQTTVDGKVTALETWKKSAEQKITDSAIISTVTSSTTYKNDLTGKVDSNKIISTINQTAEAVKIDASKINLIGYVTVTSLSTPGATIIDGGNLKANSILAEKIAIGDFTNYVVIPTNSTFTGTSGSTEGYEVCSIKGSEKYNHANISNKLYGINGGDKFRVKAMIKSDTVGSRLDITCCWRNANNEIVSSSTIYGTVSSANTWTEINEIITVPSRPSGASYVRFKINIQAEQYRRIYVERLNITRMYSGELIVDGSITSIKLSADAIDGRTIKGAIIVGGELRGSSNFFTSPDPNSVDGYAFRIYSTGELHSNNLILTSIGNNYSRLESSGVISCSKQVNSPAIITGGQSLWLGIRGVTPGSESNFNFELTQQADKTVYFRPGYNGQAVLGHSAKMFNKVYSVNGVSSSSDRTLKENIKYLSTTANPNCRIATDITELDLYNFVKDDLVTAKFNFIGDDKQHIGFIAQDLLYNADGTDNRIGQIIVNKPDDERSPLSYNEKIYVNVLAGALRYAINEIENLKNKIDKLKKGA